MKTNELRVRRIEMDSDRIGTFGRRERVMGVGLLGERKAGRGPNRHVIDFI